MTKSPLLEGQFAILFYKAAPTETAIQILMCLMFPFMSNQRKKKRTVLQFSQGIEDAAAQDS